MTIELRVSGLAIPTHYAWCETEHITYIIGLVTNARLVTALQTEAEAINHPRGIKVHLLGETRYQGDPWPQPRRVVMKGEVLAKRTNTWFVVTTRPDEPTAVYDWYVGQREAENWIKELKMGCFAHRLSCLRFWANQVRLLLLLHTAAYVLLDTIRHWLVTAKIARMTLRLRVLKIGGCVREYPTRVRLRLSSSHRGEGWWHTSILRE